MKQEKTLQFTVLVEIQPAHKTEFNNWYNDEFHSRRRTPGTVPAGGHGESWLFEQCAV